MFSGKRLCKCRVLGCSPCSLTVHPNCQHPKHRVKHLAGPFTLQRGLWWQMLLCAKVPTVARMARDAVSQHNMCVVVGLQSTGEAGINKVPGRGP